MGLHRKFIPVTILSHIKFTPCLFLFLFLYAINFQFVFSVSSAVAETTSCHAKGYIANNAEKISFIPSSWNLIGFPPACELKTLADITDDGCTDLIFICRQDKFADIYFGKSNCVDTFTANRWDSSSISTKINDIEIVSGDFNGDSQQDLIIHDKQSGKWYFHKHESDFKFGNSIVIPLPKLPEAKHIFARDFNNDGLSDLAFFSRTHSAAWLVYFQTNLQFVNATQFKDLFVKHGFNINQLHPRLNGGSDRFNFVWNYDTSYDLKERSLHTRWFTDSPSSTEKIPFAGFKTNINWKESFVGDFNGDSRTDLLIRGTSLSGWWIAFSDGTFGLEFPVSGSAPYETEPDKAGIGDFNGDGLDDVYSFSNLTQAVRVALASLPPTPEVEIMVNDTFSTKSNALGYFEFDVPCNKKLEIVPRKKGYSIIPSSRSAVIRNGTISAPFYSEQIVREDGMVGQAFQFGEKKPGPYICLGYNPTSYFHNWAINISKCPTNHAYYSVSEKRRKLFSNTAFYYEGTCCPLPKSDILSDSNIEAIQTCPEGYIATGTKANHSCDSCTQYVICSKINTLRYQLGPKTPGKYWGLGFSARKQSPRIDRLDLPLAIRYGIGRSFVNKWGQDGCIGFPYGSLFVSRNSNYSSDCKNYFFPAIAIYRAQEENRHNKSPVALGISVCRRQTK